MNRWSRMPTTSAGCRRSDSGVKSTTSANRIEAAANWSAIVAGVGLEPVGDRARQDVQQQVLGRSCSTRSAASASSRWRTNCARSPNTTAPATVTLSAIIVRREPGRQGRPAAGQLAHDPGDEEHRDEGDEPAHPGARAVEHEGAERGQDAPQADGARRRRSRRRTPSRSSGRAGCRAARPGGTDSVSRVREKIAIAAIEMSEVQPGDEARHGAEGEVDRAPDERDREDVLATFGNAGE